MSSYLLQFQQKQSQIAKNRYEQHVNSVAADNDFDELKEIKDSFVKSARAEAVDQRPKK